MVTVPVWVAVVIIVAWCVSILITYFFSESKGYAEGRIEQRDIDAEIIKELRLIGCLRKCARRRTTSAYVKIKIADIGRDLYIKELEEAKEMPPEMEEEVGVFTCLHYERDTSESRDNIIMHEGNTEPSEGDHLKGTETQETGSTPDVEGDDVKLIRCKDCDFWEDERSCTNKKQLYYMCTGEIGECPDDCHRECITGVSIVGSMNHCEHAERRR
jgi:hypothetical protein